MALTNQSGVSFKWLTRRLSASDGTSLYTPTWQRVRDSMRNTSQSVTSLQDWMSDFWMCKTAEVSFAGIKPKWDPPDALDEWCSVQSGLLQAYAPNGLRPTNHSTFLDVLNHAEAIGDETSDAAVSEFYALDDLAMSGSEPVAMMQAQHVRAWLSTALGNLLSSIALSPQEPFELLERESRRRLQLPRELKAAPRWGFQFEEGELGILYNCRQTPQGTLSWRGIRIGQGEEWLKHWQWLSQPVDPVQILHAVALAARLLRCGPLVAAMLATLETDDVGLQHLALAVLRRWLLSLRVMAWLEDALRRRWVEIRAPDLVCLAFNAVKPDWPRRVIGLSHRSMDAKPPLMTMKAWRSSLFAIDANYAPSWETNTGMIWGLFAATPVLVKISSPNYQASEWCRREEEMLHYLEHTCDFMDHRFVMNASIEQIATLDHFVDAWRPLSALHQHVPDFPPLSQVYIPGAQPEWVLRILRAAAALRLFHAVYGTMAPDVANRLAQLLSSSDPLPPIEPPTNNLDGWAAYRRIFRELQHECGLEVGATPLWFPPNAAPWHPDRAQAFTDAIPDLGRDEHSLVDVLAAIEWRETLLPLLEEASLGDMTLIDLRGLSREQWETNPSLSLSRGIAALRSPPRPIWLLQRAGQDVDRWNLPMDHPIFTEHAQSQFAWMMFEGTLSPEWPAYYAERSGLTLSAPLLAKCRATRRDSTDR